MDLTRLFLFGSFQAAGVVSGSSGSSATRSHADTGYPSVTSASSPARVAQGGTFRGSSLGSAPSQPPSRANAGSSVPTKRGDSQGALDRSISGSDDCEQPLPQPTASIFISTSTSNGLDGSDDCEQPLPQPSAPIPPTPTSPVVAKDGSDDCEQPLPQPAIHIHPSSASHGHTNDSSDGCEQPLPQPTATSAPLRSSVSINVHNDADDCEQPLPQPTASILISTSTFNGLDGSDDCEQPLPQPSTPIVSNQAVQVDANDGSGDCLQPLPSPALRHTPTASPSSAAIATTAHKPTDYPPTSPNVFLRVSLRPFCVGDATPVSVEGVKGVFCVPGFYICSSHRADGACPGVQHSLPDGSHCGIVRTGVFGCRPGSHPLRLQSKLLSQRHNSLRHNWV
jgi:hypothetical protein